jgi:hypothetical protein
VPTTSPPQASTSEHESPPEELPLEPPEELLPEEPAPPELVEFEVPEEHPLDTIPKTNANAKRPDWTFMECLLRF